MFLKISLPQLFVYEKSVNVRLGWKGDWDGRVIDAHYSFRRGVWWSRWVIRV